MVSTNDVFTACVRDVSSDGNGIVAHPSGRIFFVPGVWLGEVGEFRITECLSSYGYAQLIKLTEPAATRVEPRCPHHGVEPGNCGNCPWQFISYEEQLKAKYHRLLKGMSRLGEEFSSKVRPIWKSPTVYGYRNRAQFKTDGKAFGYVSGRSHEIAAVTDCPILTEKNRQTLRQLLTTMPRKDFCPTSGSLWTTVDIDGDLQEDEVIKINAQRPFRQANSAQNERMKAWLAARLKLLDKKSPVLELFSGSGNFTEVISREAFEKIVAVDMQRDELKSLTARKLPGVQTFSCNLYARNAFTQIAKIIPAPKIVVFDPPRGGVKNRYGFTNQFCTITDIIYISCNDATFTRDVGHFVGLNFEVVEIQPLDAFPHTPHVEILAHLRRKG